MPSKEEKMHQVQITPEAMQSIHVSHVRYNQERLVMKLDPGESRNYHGHGILKIRKGSATITSPMKGCPVQFKEVEIKNGQIQKGEVDMLVFTITAGPEGCEFSIHRPHLEALEK